MTSCSLSEGGTLVRRAGAACKLALVRHLQWEFLGKCVAKCSADVACSGRVKCYFYRRRIVSNCVFRWYLNVFVGWSVSRGVCLMVSSVWGVWSLYCLSELLTKLASPRLKGRSKSLQVSMAKRTTMLTVHLVQGRQRQSSVVEISQQVALVNRKWWKSIKKMMINISIDTLWNHYNLGSQTKQWKYKEN
jgi:hypothetical protein